MNLGLGLDSTALRISDEDVSELSTEERYVDLCILYGISVASLLIPMQINIRSTNRTARATHVGSVLCSLLSMPV